MAMATAMRREGKRLAPLISSRSSLTSPLYQSSIGAARSISTQIVLGEKAKARLISDSNKDTALSLTGSGRTSPNRNSVNWTNDQLYIIYTLRMRHGEGVLYSRTLSTLIYDEITSLPRLSSLFEDKSCNSIRSKLYNDHMRVIRTTHQNLKPVKRDEDGSICWTPLVFSTYMLAQFYHGQNWDAILNDEMIKPHLQGVTAEDLMFRDKNNVLQFKDLLVEE